MSLESGLKWQNIYFFEMNKNSTLESGISVGLRLLIFEKKKEKNEKWPQCLDWCKNELKFWCENF